MRLIVRLIQFLVIAVLIAVISLFFLPSDRIARIAADQISRATGRQVEISGDVSISVWPVLGVRMGGLEVANADWSDKGPMLKTEDAAVGVNAAALFSGNIDITTLEVSNPVIRLEAKSDGRANWVFDTLGGDGDDTEVSDPSGASSRDISLRRLRVTNASLSYDVEGADPVAFDGVDLSLDWPNVDEAAELAATITPAGSAVNIRARFERFARFLQGEVEPISAELSTTGGSLNFGGQGDINGNINGAMTVNFPDTEAVLSALGVAGIEIPEGLGRSVELSSNISFTSEQRLSLRELIADLGGNQVTGAVDMALSGATPQINAQINAGDLDMSAATGATGSGASESSAQAGWPTDQIPADWLAGFEGEIALSANSVDLGQFQLGATQALLTNERSRMVFQLQELAAYGGQVTGQFVMNNRNGLSVGGRLQANSLAVQPLLSDAADLNKLTGLGNFQLSFLGVGETVAQIMNSLSGDGRFDITEGTIQGIDLDQLMRTGQADGGTTVFDRLSASFNMQGGVMRNDDLLLELRNYEARGDGQMGLGAQTIDYTFTPVALRANEGNGIAIPVRIRGPWSDPTIRPDLEAAIDLNLGAKIEEEKQRVEQQARQAVREKIVEGLDITDEGQDLEEAVRDRVEDKLEEELQRGLRSLFD